MAMNQNPIPDFEKATQEYLDNPSQVTQLAFYNWFANVIHFKGEVIAVMLIEDVPEYKDPIMRMNRITVGDKTFFGFYTSEEKLADSDFDADFIKMPLETVVELTLADNAIAGLIVNPSQGRDASIPSAMIRQCYEAVKGYKGPILQ